MLYSLVHYFFLINLILISSADFIGADYVMSDLLGENRELVGENVSLASGEQTPHFGGGDCSMKHWTRPCLFSTTHLLLWLKLRFGLLLMLLLRLLKESCLGGLMYFDWSASILSLIAYISGCCRYSTPKSFVECLSLLFAILSSRIGVGLWLSYLLSLSCPVPCSRLFEICGLTFFLRMADLVLF